MKRLICLTVLSLVGVLLPHVMPGAEGAGTCAQPRVFVEAQSWWAPAPGTIGGNNFGHVHLGACIPERDVLTESTTVSLTLILHHNPGTLADISVVFKTTASEITVAKLVPSQRNCPLTDTCTITVNAPIDISKFDRSGLQEIRFRAFVDEPDGKRMHTSLNFQTYVKNGKPVSDVTRLPHLRAKGWYTDFGYCEADILSVPLPDKPLSGVVAFKVQQIDHGPDDADVTSHSVRLDSNAHLGLPGIPLSVGTGPLAATTLAVDTRGLTNGTHRLVQRADCARGNQVNSGVNVFLFDVLN